LFVAFALGAALNLKCESRRSENRRARELAEAQRLDAPPTVAPPLPVEPPLEKVRVADAGLPCDVDDVLARKCRRCHTTPPRHNAPFELYTWDDTQSDRFGKPLYVDIGRVVETGYMPLTALTANPPIEHLTPEEKRVLIDWVDAGAPKMPCDPDAGAPEKATPKRRKVPRARDGGLAPTQSVSTAPAAPAGSTERK
jgi:hypothetical protein